MKRILSYSLALSLCLLFSLPAVADAFLGRDRGPTYAITLSAENASPGIVGPTVLTATLTKGGSAVPGESVAFTWQVRGESGGPQAGPITATNAVGQATYELNNIDTTPRTITVTATLASNPKVSASVDVRFELPPGIIAMAPVPMGWADARAFCQQQGGRLPRVNNSDSLPVNAIWDFASDRTVAGTSVDAFGSVGRPWAEVGLPANFYMTSTEVSDRPAGSWYANIPDLWWLVHSDSGGNVNVTIAINLNHRSFNLRVVCVP